MTASTRRAALGAILVAPLASVPAVAAQPEPSPDLIRLIARHDRFNGMLDALTDDEVMNCDRRLMRVCAALRTRVMAFPSKGLPDIMAKVVCLARIWPLSDLQFEVDAAIRQRAVYMDNMADGIVLELAKLAEGTLCA